MTELKKRLLRLTRNEKDRLKVLFLARLAPNLGDERPELDDRHGVEPRYNHELLATLQSLGVACQSCRSLDEFLVLANDANYVFTIFNRADFRNCEIFVSLQCEKMGIPYMGAPPNVRALAEDKNFAKHLASSLGLRTPEWTTYRVNGPLLAPEFDGPYFVKPRFGASSDEVALDSIQDAWPGLKAKISSLLMKGKDVIVERCIAGTDLTVPVLGGDPPMVLGVLEEVSDLPSGISTYRQKRLLEQGRVRRVLDNPALTEQVMQNVQRFVAHVTPFDYLRVDFRLCQETKQAYFLEFNIGCNLGSHAAIMFAATQLDIERHYVIEHILAYSLARQAVSAQ